MELKKWKPPYVDINSNPPFGSAIQGKTDSTLAWLKSVPAGPERNKLIELALRFAGNKPEVRALFSELPPESSVEAARSCVYRIFDDAEARVNFAASIPAGPAREAAWHAVGTRSSEPVPLPPGPDREATLHGMVLINSFKPERAWELMKQIDDPQRRLQVWDDIALNLSNPSSSFTAGRLQTWLNLPDMPEKWKQPWKAK